MNVDKERRRLLLREASSSPARRRGFVLRSLSKKRTFKNKRCRRTSAFSKSLVPQLPGTGSDSSTHAGLLKEWPAAGTLPPVAAPDRSLLGGRERDEDSGRWLLQRIVWTHLNAHLFKVGAVKVRIKMLNPHYLSQIFGTELLRVCLS